MPDSMEGGLQERCAAWDGTCGHPLLRDVPAGHFTGVRMEHPSTMGEVPMDEIKSYIDDDNQAIVRCGECGRKKVIDASKFKTLKKLLTVKCACSHAFSVSFESRKSYRKDVLLSGEYMKDGGEQREACEVSVGGMRCGSMVLENLALGGVAFRTNQNHDIRVGDIIQVKFRLDDVPKSLITRNIVVKSVVDRQVRGEFCDCRPDKALAFYLMP
jgi:hypothetical protein